MPTQLEKLVMNIQEIANHSPLQIECLVEYNGKVKLVIHQSIKDTLFIIDYHFHFKKIMTEIDITFPMSTQIDKNSTKILIYILLAIFEIGQHEAIICNTKNTDNQLSFFQPTLLTNWQKFWGILGYTILTKKGETTSQKEKYSLEISTIWRQERTLEGELFYYFYREVTPYTFTSIYIHQVHFHDQVISIEYIVNELSNTLSFSVHNNRLIIEDTREQKYLASCSSIHDFKLWLQNYFLEQSTHISNSPADQDTHFVKILLQRSIGELPHDKLEFFAYSCLQYLQSQFPNEDVEQYIANHLEQLEIYPLNTKIVGITYHDKVLCICKTSNLTWMSQNKLLFTIVENT